MDNKPKFTMVTMGSDENEEQSHFAQSEQKKQTAQSEKKPKLPRINMEFSNGNHDYLKIISRIEGVSITEYVNKLIAEDKTRRADEIEKAKTILKNI